MESPYRTCYRHPDRYTGVGCQRCGRPVCGECALPASVGFHCPDCVAQAQGGVSRPAKSSFLAQLKQTPLVSSLLATNIAVWVFIMVTGGGNSSLVDTLALHRMSYCALGGHIYGSTGQAVCTASGGVFSPGIMDGAVWQLITSAFTHISPMHIAFNMMALWVLGPQLEKFLGRAKFALLYFGSALTASVFVFFLTEPFALTLGASGAVFGLMGALAVIVLKQRGNARSILFWIGANVLITIVGGAGISWQGHLGGLIGGVLITLALMRSTR